MNLKLGWKKGKGISMASIRERNGKFNVIYNYKDDSGKRRQKWETYDTKAEAKKRKREIEYKQEMGALVVRKCNTLSDLLTEYVSLYGKEKWALSTYEGNVGLIRNYIEPMVGSVKLSEINTRFMEKYYQGLLQTKAVGNPVKGNKKNEFVSASTVREIHKLLRNCFEQAIKWEMIEKNPCTYATVPKHKSQKREIWTAETLMYAMDVCEDERLKLAINLSFSCSLRLGEVLGLTWDCVDISPEAIEENRAYVYINKETQRVTKETLKNLEGKDGGDIKAVQGDSGHSQVDMVTDVYSHIIDEDRRRNAELFEEAFYEKKNLDPKMREETTTQTVDVPDDVDAELLAKVLANPEMKALLASLAKAMK